MSDAPQYSGVEIPATPIGEVGEHHQREGWYFKRLDDGSVRIRHASETPHIIPPNEWESILRELSAPTEKRECGPSTAPLLASEIPATMTAELEKWADEIQEAILDAAADVQEGGSGSAIPMLNARLSLVRALVDGRRDTFDTSEDVRVSRKELEGLRAILEASETPATVRCTRAKIEIAGWLSSGTAQPQEAK